MGRLAIFLLPAGHLSGPQSLPTPDSYSGSLLALAATADGRRLAAAGEAVEADTLQPAQQQQELARVAARRGSAAARRGRSKKAAGLDLLNMTGEKLRACAAVACGALIGPCGVGFTQAAPCLCLPDCLFVRCVCVCLLLLLTQTLMVLALQVVRCCPAGHKPWVATVGRQTVQEHQLGC